MKRLPASFFPPLPAIAPIGALLTMATLLPASEPSPASDNEAQLVEHEFRGESDSHRFVLQTRAPDTGAHPEGYRALSVYAFETRTGIVYGGPLTLEWIMDGQTLHTERYESADVESLYTMHQLWPEPVSSSYALRVTLHDHDDLECVITLPDPPPPIPGWGRWIGGAMLLLFILAIVAARKYSTKKPPVTGTASI